MFLIFFIILFIILTYYLYYIGLFRYIDIINEQNINFYDNKYINLKRSNLKRKIIISLTTIPSRINKLKPTLISLLDQTNKVDKIYINIPYKTIKGKKYNIPEWLNKLHNIKINRVVKDYGPATKLLPVLKKDAIIIVVDDDVIYGSRLVEDYINMFKKKNCALTTFGAFVKNNHLVDEWPTFMRFREAQYVDILMGHNSFLVTPEMFPKNVFNFEKAPKECIWSDDVWFSGWLKHNQIHIYSLGFSFNNIPMTMFENDPSTSLCSTENITQHNNNITLKYFNF